MARNYYEILNVSYKASAQEIKVAFRLLAKKYHPDKNPGNQEMEDHFKSISEAYLILSDPNKKANYDWNLYQKYVINTQGKAVYRPKTVYQRPRYHPNPFYRYAKYTYSKKVKRQGAIFVICLALVVIIIPLGLEIFSAERHFDNGLAYYKTGNYFAAINSLEQSFRPFGLRNLEASMLASKIVIYKYNDFSYALKYIEIGLNAADNDNDFGELYYLRALCQKNIHQTKKALKNFQKSLKYNPHSDSTLLELGELNAFIFNNYPKALQHFDKIDHTSNFYKEAYFGKGYCFFHLQELTTSLNYFEEFIKYDDSGGMPFYFKGLIQLKLGRLSEACKSLKKASSMGVMEAENLVITKCPKVIFRTDF
ncbi:MAG: DnaJ domain-containing protein [Bacteroidetes bacterium]|nr:DnaJ domain-containing protein [Bacteroidota bacterium]